MNTLFAIDEFDTVDSPKWSDYAVTVSYSDDEIIRMIISLHNDGKSFDCDPTYSKSHSWQHDLSTIKYEGGQQLVSPSLIVLLPSTAR